MGCEACVVPKEAKVAVVEFGLSNEPSGVVERLLVVESHIFRFVERAIHNGERMEHKRTKAASGWIDELDRATSAKTEASNVGVAHGEIVGDMGIDERFHIDRLQ